MPNIMKQCPTVIPCILKILSNFGCNELALVAKDGKMMNIDHSGAVVWEER